MKQTAARPTGPIQLSNLPARGRIVDVRGWRAFVTRLFPTRPELPERKVWGSWSEAQRQAYNHSRHLYHANFPPIATPDLQDFQSQMLLQIWKNIDGDDGTPPGGLLDGLGTLGKTTILKHLGRRFELEFTERYPAEDPAQQHLVIPVIYIGMVARASPKDLCLALARFFNFPLPINTNPITRTDLMAAVIDAINLHQTQLIMIDDAHFINMRTEAGQVANDFFKEIMDKTRCTCVFAGIDCRGLLTEGRGPAEARKSQIGGRLICKVIAPMTRDGNVWTGLLTQLESGLVLARMRPGTLSQGLSDYLYGRTGGSIGSLLNLIRKAARVAVDSGGEQIAEELLQSIQSDYNAERAGRSTKSPSKATRRP